MTAKENLDERQSELAEARTAADELVVHLSCAESCETVEDFDANIDSAKSACALILTIVREGGRPE